MTTPFGAAKLERKRRTKWWREHAALAYIILAASSALLFLCVRFIDRRLPEWLASLGVSPPGVNLIFGTAWCGLGLWGIRTKGNGTAQIIASVLCLLGGVLTLAKAFQFF